LRDWIAEKTAQSGQKIDKDHIDSFDLATLRREGPDYVSIKLFAAQKGTVMVVNAADEADMDVVVLGVLQGMSITSSFHASHFRPKVSSASGKVQAD